VPTHTELDWPGVLALAGRFCASERGRRSLDRTIPSIEEKEVRDRAQLTRDLMTRAEHAVPVLLDGIDESSAPLSRLGPAGVALPAEDLLDLFFLLERSEAARHSIPVEGAELPELEKLLRPMPDFEDLLLEREVVFDPDGRVKDTASTRLASIRGSIVRLRRELVKRLEELVRNREEAFADTYVTEKGGRYCLPVRSDRRELVAGIVHEKSGSGQTFFVEPLAIVEGNNALAEALEEERAEIRRILTALTTKFSLRRHEITFALEILTELDAYQARAEFCKMFDGTFPEFGPVLSLRRVRHPLLDRRLSGLREKAFGERPEERGSDAVPLDIELPEGRRLLLLSGPNAGGKTVAMKTAGLCALMAQSGFALPAAAGTSLPVFDQVLVVAGDAQDMLADLSSFAASMTRTSQVLRIATPRSLVLFDELGSGTDPDEGAALAVSILERDLERGGVTVATTHLSAVKEWAHARADALAAAMEFDEAAGRPTFQIKPGAVGRSRAIPVARKAGIPLPVLEAATNRLGTAWRAAEDALERLERETSRAKQQAENAQILLFELKEKEERLEAEAARVQAEKARLKEKSKTALDKAIEALREKARRELDQIRDSVKSGRSVSKGALTTILHEAEAAARTELDDDEDAAPAGPVEPGMQVKIEPYRMTGVVLSIDSRGQAEVEASGKRLFVPVSGLRPLPGQKPAAKKLLPQERPAGSADGGRARSTGRVFPELVLVGFRVDDAIPEIERAINSALLEGMGGLRIVHGHGTGRLAAGVKDFLSEHPAVSSFRPGDGPEGGTAVTVAFFDV
jgi:DNA mismatch repair protein MutS2